MMEEQQPDTPETWRGELAELMVQYGAPASAVLKIANRAKKLQVVKNIVEKMGTSKASKIAQRVGAGIGNIFASLISAIARNPSARPQVFPMGMLGFALVEAVALYALLIAFLVLFLDICHPSKTQKVIGFVFFLCLIVPSPIKNSCN